jgi:hypothetical protein
VRPRPHNYAQIEKHCEKCGALFRVSPRGASARFCSRACFYKTRFGDFNLQTQCATCGKTYKINQWKLTNHKRTFCSVACKNEGKKNRIIVVCESCGVSFGKRASQVYRSARNFCSDLCSQVFHSGKNHHGYVGGVGYGFEWKAARAAVRIRDKVCQRCGRDKSEDGRRLDVHHIKPFRFFGYERRMDAHDLSNLIALCRSCHKIIEEGGL